MIWSSIMRDDTVAKVELCQIENAQHAGRPRRPGIFYAPSRIVSNIKTRGLWYTLRVTANAQLTNIREGLGIRAQDVRTPQCDDAILNLQPGELVLVKPLEEILKTLDAKGRFRGLVFTPEMQKHCNKQYRVFKRLELMFDEYHKSQRRIKNTVLLEGVVCEGAGLGCDRSCFLYWREAWLRRVQ